MVNIIKHTPPVPAQTYLVGRIWVLYFRQLAAFRLKFYDVCTGA